MKPPQILASVTRALEMRRSVRAFKPDPVPDAVLRAVIDAAILSPSGGNVQPWRVHVVTGPAIVRLKQLLQNHAETGWTETPSHEVYPAGLWEPYRSRRFQNGEDFYNVLGIDRHDKVARLAQLAKNFQFFGAPVGLFFTIDTRMGAAQWMDVGMLMQSVMLIAVEYGLATCAQAAWSLWPDTLGECLSLPEMTRVAAGMALGYEDLDHIANRFNAGRAALDELVTFHDI